MRQYLRRIPFSYLGYILLLISSAFLGVFITLLGTDGSTGWTIWSGIATVATLLVGVSFIRFQVVESHDNEPQDEMVISAQPMIPGEERSEFEEYREEHPHNRADDTGN